MGKVVSLMGSEANAGIWLHGIQMAVCIWAIKVSWVWFAVAPAVLKHALHEVKCAASPCGI